jgi:hypothetical protein
MKKSIGRATQLIIAHANLFFFLGAQSSLERESCSWGLSDSRRLSLNSKEMKSLVVPLFFEVENQSLKIF